MRNAAAGEGANFAKEFASAFKGCDGSGKSAPDAMRLYFATKGIRAEQQSRGAKQDDMDWKRIREALRVATDEADIAALEHDLAVLTKKGSPRPLFGVHAKQVKGKVASQKKAATKATKEEEKQKAVSEKAELKSAGWVCSGTTMARRHSCMRDGSSSLASLLWEVICQRIRRGRSTILVREQFRDFIVP